MSVKFTKEFLPSCGCLLSKAGCVLALLWPVDVPTTLINHVANII